jgi:hypothetical protein
VLNHKTESDYLVDFDKLLSDGKTSLQAIAECLKLENKNKLVEAAASLRSTTTQPIEANEFSPDILQAALDIHERLKSIAI